MSEPAAHPDRPRGFGFRPDSDQRVRAHEPTELLIEANLDPELCRRQVRDFHSNHFACIHSSHLILGACDDPGNIRKFGIKLHVPCEAIVVYFDYDN